MSSEKQKVVFERELHLPQLVGYLESIAGGLKTGKLGLSHGGRSISLTPAPVVRTEIRAKRKGGRRTLAFEVTWDSDQEQIGAAINGTELSSPGMEPPEAVPASSPEAVLSKGEIDEMLANCSREELYEKAQRLELEGRSQLSKEDLIRKLASGFSPLELFSRKELYERARAAEVAGRSRMTKEELIESLEHQR